MAPRPTCECGTCAKCRRRVYMRDYYSKNRDRVCATATASRQRRIDAARAYDRERGYRPGDPEKMRARQAVKFALKNGTLTREPCEVCGDPLTQAHHDDYRLRLVVRWLCSAHHGIEHRSAA